MPEADTLRAVYRVGRHDHGAIGRLIARTQSIGSATYIAADETEAVRHRTEATWRSRGSEWIEVTWRAEQFVHMPVSYLFTVLLGGQCDQLRRCILEEVELPPRFRPGPAHGIAGLRRLLRVPTRPLCGVILKPKWGLEPETMLRLIRDCAEAGVDIIKEDELLGNQTWPLAERLPTILDALHGWQGLYLATVGPGWPRAPRDPRLGWHLNTWQPWDHLLELRRQGPHHPILHGQTSGHQVWCSGEYAMRPEVYFSLLRDLGVDLAQVGMLDRGRETFSALRAKQLALAPAAPTFSSGVTAEDVPQLVDCFGRDLVVFSGGWVCGHPDGPRRGAALLRAACERMQ